MPYVDKDYYTNVYQGESVSSADFPKLLDLAEILVNEMCMFRVSDTSFQSMPAVQQDAVKKAVCAQIEYLQANGGRDFLNESDALQSAGLGKFSYTKTQSAGGTATDESYSPLARRYLFPTGFLYRGGDY